MPHTYQANSHQDREQSDASLSLWYHDPCKQSTEIAP